MGEDSKATGDGMIPVFSITKLACVRRAQQSMEATRESETKEGVSS